jgi:hypothetical protein
MCGDAGGKAVTAGGGQAQAIGWIRVGGCRKVMFEARSFARASVPCERRPINLGILNPNHVPDASC